MSPRPPREPSAAPDWPFPFSEGPRWRRIEATGFIGATSQSILVAVILYAVAAFVALLPWRLLTRRCCILGGCLSKQPHGREVAPSGSGSVAAAGEAAGEEEERRVAKHARNFNADFVELIPARVKNVAVVTLSYAATLMLNLSNDVDGMDARRFIETGVLLLWLFAVLYFFWGLIDVAARQYKKIKRNFHISDTIATFFHDTAKLVLSLIFLLVIFTNFGVDMTAVTASVSVVAFALSFGAQDFVKQICGLFIILVDQPFGLGDHVTVGGVDGIVQKVSFRSFQIKGWDKAIHIVPNATVLTAVVVNHSYKEETEERLQWTLDYGSGTAADYGELRRSLLEWLRRRDDTGSFADVKLDLAPEGVQYGCTWFHNKGEALVREGKDPNWNFFEEARLLREQVVLHVCNEVKRLHLEFATFPIRVAAAAAGAAGSAGKAP